ncbi:MAG: Spy/CpxP family protein refolding chaperone [Alphaproteobacteria bacterium]|nr:Spy/CpxP family protein refolding chaperone [Alphaproteobacteria bacterium]
MTDHAHRRHRGRRRFGILGLLCAFALGAFALPRAFAAYTGGHGCHRGGDFTAEEVRDHMGHGADWILDEVDATDAQRDQIDAVLDEAAPEMVELHAEGRGLKDELRGLLAAPTLDREAIEQVRLDGVDLADRASTRALGWMVRVAEVLTPEQRADLAELHEEWSGEAHGKRRPHR